MKFECPKCKKSGQVDDSKVPESGVYATCPQCNNRFLVKREVQKDFEFEPVVENKKLNGEPIPTPEESTRQFNKSISRKQLYQAAVGKNIDYYLPIFERFDRDGKTSSSWNWAACFGGWLWCCYRGMTRIGSLLFMIMLVLTAMDKADKQNSIAIPLFILDAAVLVGFGMYANSFYYNRINKKIRILDLNHNKEANLELFRKSFKPNKLALYILGVFIGLTVIGIIAAIAIPQYSAYRDRVYASRIQKVEAPAPSPAVGVDVWAGLNTPAPSPAVETPKPTLDEIYADKNTGFIIGNDVVTDTHTGLMWARDGLIGRMSWKDAMRWVESLNYGGYNGWRLPIKEEIESFAKLGGNQPSEWFNANGFNNVQPFDYWTGSVRALSSRAWYLNMGGGYVGYEGDNGNYSDRYVWPVRGGR